MSSKVVFVLILLSNNFLLYRFNKQTTSLCSICYVGWFIRVRNYVNSKKVFNWVKKYFFLSIFFKILTFISRINESIPGMFVLIWMHFPWWFQICSWNYKMLTFFKIIVTILTCRLLTSAALKALTLGMREQLNLTHCQLGHHVHLFSSFPTSQTMTDNFISKSCNLSNFDMFNNISLYFPFFSQPWIFDSIAIQTNLLRILPCITRLW